MTPTCVRRGMMWYFPTVVRKLFLIPRYYWHAINRTWREGEGGGGGSATTATNNTTTNNTNNTNNTNTNINTNTNTTTNLCRDPAPAHATPLPANTPPIDCGTATRRLLLMPSYTCTSAWGWGVEGQ